MLPPEKPLAPEDLYTLSVSGFSATCDAFAYDEPLQSIYFLSILGAHTSVKAIWANLLKQPPATGYLSRCSKGTPIEQGYKTCLVPYQTQGTWTTVLTRLPNSRAWHCLIYTKMAEYSYERNHFLILPATEDQAPQLHHRYLDKRVATPLHPSWDTWLWNRAMAKGEAKELSSTGFKAYWCTPNQEQLKRDISLAAQSGDLMVHK